MNKERATTRDMPQPGVNSRFKAYLLDHPRVLLFSLGKLYRAPLASLMTIAVLAIALALPTALYLLLLNAQVVSSGWDGNPRISLYLHAKTDNQTAQKLARTLKARDEIREVVYLSPEQALNEFRDLSGFGEVLDALDENPLPPVLVLEPRDEQIHAGLLVKLAAEFETLPEVEQAQLDIQWVRRLYSIIDLVQRGVWVLAGLLAIAVLLIVGNTIRLDILNRKEEIEVVKLIGATNAFIRRPFLYGGFWYGLWGGCLALVLVSAALAVLSKPVQVLAKLYQSDYQLLSVNFELVCIVILISSLLGWLGSWIAVGRHLGKIEPS